MVPASYLRGTSKLVRKATSMRQDHTSTARCRISRSQPLLRNGQDRHDRFSFAAQTLSASPRAIPAQFNCASESAWGSCAVEQANPEAIFHVTVRLWPNILASAPRSSLGRRLAQPVYWRTTTLSLWLHCHAFQSLYQHAGWHRAFASQHGFSSQPA